MAKKVLLIIFVLVIVASTMVVVLFQVNKRFAAGTKYSEYTLEHSLTKKYTAKDYKNAEILVDAIWSRDDKEIKRLLKTNMEFNCPMVDEMGDVADVTPLEQALLLGDNKTASALLKKGAVATPICDVQTPIVAVLRSSEKGDLNMVKLLIEKGADPVKDSPDMSAIIYAAGLMYDNKDYQQEPPEDATEIFKLFESMGADIYFEMEHYGSNVLTFAACSNNLLLLQYLVEEKGMDVNYRGVFGSTALISVAHSDNSTKITKYLLKHGADKAMVDDFGKTALDYAVEYGNQQIINLLSQ